MSVSEIVKSAGDSWIVCRSKSHSGRIYYFNTLNGQAVWNLSEPEKEKAKSTTKALEKHPDFKSVNCPEPSNSPQDSNPQKHIPVHQLMQPKIYNKQVINNSFSKPQEKHDLLPYTQLAPIQFNIPIATISASVWNATPQSTFDASSNISQSNLLMNNDNYVPSRTSMSLSNRFKNICDSNVKLNPSPTRTFNRNYGILSKKHFYKKKRQFLDNNDLRTFLKTKRRNRTDESQDYNFEQFGEHSSSNSQLIYETENETITYDTDDDYWLQKNLNSQANITKIDTNSLKSLLQVEDTSSWYIVADSNVFLNHVNFINILMKSDCQCRLMIPQQVMNKIKVATNSRLRTQSHRAAYFISEKVDENVATIDQDDTEANVFYKDAIIKCCRKLIEECNPVVLLTDDIELHSTECSIPIYTVMEIKNILNNPKSHRIIPRNFENFPLKQNRNIKITIENDTNTDKLNQQINTDTVAENKTTAYECESNYDKKHLTNQTNDKTITKQKKQTSQNEGMLEYIVNKLKSLEKKTDDIGIQAGPTDLVVEQDKLNSNDTLQSDKIEFAQTKSIKLKRQTSLDIVKSNATMKHLKQNKRKAKSTLCLISENSVTDEHNEVAQLVSNSTKECMASVLNSKNNTDPKSTSKNKCDSLIRKTNMDIPKPTNTFENFIQGKEQSKEQNIEDKIEVSDQSENVMVENITVASFTSNNKCDNLLSETTNTEIAKSKKTFEDTRQLKKQNISDRIENVMFEVTDEAMEQYLKMKCDEWTSRFVQIMEEVLTQVLQIDPPYVLDTMPPPWNIYEATECVKRKFNNVDDIFDATTKLSSVLFEFGASRGKIKTDISPQKYMEMYSYGVYVIDTLQGNLINVEDLNTAEQSLSKLLRDIQDPHLDPSNHDLFTDTNIENQITCSEPDALNETFESNCNNTNLDTSADVSTSKSKSSKKSNVSSNYRLRSHRKRLLQEQENKDKSVPETIFIRNIDYKSTFFTSLNLRNNCVNNKNEVQDNIVKEVEKNNELVNDDQMVNHNEMVNNNEVTNDNEVVNNKESNKINTINTSNIVKETELKENIAVTGPKFIRNFTKCIEFEEKLKNIHPETDSVRDNWFIQSESDYTGNEELDYEDDEYFYDNDYDDYECNNEENEIHFNNNTENKNVNFKLFMEKIKDEIKISFLAIHSFCTKSYEVLNSEDCKEKKSKIQVVGKQMFTHLNSLCDVLSRILTRDTSDLLRLKELLQIDSLEEHNIINDDVVEEYMVFIKKFVEQGNTLRDSIKLVIEACEE